MKLSQRGIDFIAGWEKLALTAYRDTGGVLTVGFGHTGPDVTEGLTITPERAVELLKQDTARAAHDVTVLTIDVPLTQSQFDALTSLAFNIGTHAFGGSTLLKMLQTHQYMAAAAEFLRWRYDGKKELLGLARRRAAEAVLFLTD